MSIRWLMMAAHVPRDGQRGGMVRYVVELARALGQHPIVDLNVVASADAEPFWETIVASPAKIHRMRDVPVPLQAWMERQGRGSRAFRRSFDVVHGTKHLLPRRAHGMSMLTVHDFLPLDRPQDFTAAKRRFLPGPYLESIAQADALVCVSAATADRLACYVPTAADRTHVVPLAGSALTRSPTQPVDALLDRRFALVVGDASKRKNLRLLTRIWPEVTKRVPGAIVAIVGPPTWTGDETADGDPPGVHRLGFLPDEELAWCYRNAAVVLCPSMLEGYGLPAREALDLGAPLITSDDPALCEVSQGRAVHIAGDDERAWTQAVAEALTQPNSASRERERTWRDVAEETVEVAGHALGT